MKTTSTAHRPLRVLLAGNAPESSSALANWLSDQDGLHVTGAGRTTAETLALATVVRPDVVLLDFHGLPVPASYTVALFKELSPAPSVFVLTHDASPAMRRHCRTARVDAIFDKTAEMEALRATLAAAPRR